MKKRILFFTVALMLTALLFAFCGCGISGIAGTGGKYLYDDAVLYSTGNASVSAAGIERVSVDWICGDIAITVSDNDEIALNETAETDAEDYLLRYAVIRGELKIKFCKSGVQMGDMPAKALSVALPASVRFTKIEADNVDGKVEVSGVTAGELSIDTVNGGVSVAAAADRIEVDTVNGNVALAFAQGTGFRVEFESVNGQMRDPNGGTVKGGYYTHGSGSVSADVETVNGSLTLKVVENEENNRRKI